MSLFRVSLSIIENAYELPRQQMSHRYNCERTVWTEGRLLSELLVTFSEIHNDVVFLFSDYLLPFCVANGKNCPQPKQINEILTQQIGYSCRKLLREKGRCAQ